MHGRRRSDPSANGSSDAPIVGSPVRVVRERIAEVGEHWRYHVFVSYSVKQDPKTELRLRRALKSVGSAPLRRGRMKVYVDKESLGANPALWDRLASRLDQSGAFVLLASPDSKRSPWVRQELQHWFEKHKIDDANPHAGLPVLVLTRGELTWDRESNDFDYG